MYVSAIIAAGGRGERFGAGRPKQLLTLGGVPILQRSVEALLSHPRIRDMVVALPRELAEAPPEYLRRRDKPIVIVEGGARRQDSVARAFARVPGDAEVVVIHDAARPLVSADLIERTVVAAAEDGAAVAAVRATDTVKRGDAGGRVVETLPREHVYLAQTPQAFRVGVLRDALAIAADATDEATLAERAGHRVRLVEGDAANVKITTPEDLRAAERTVAAGAPAIRIGQGYDLHRLVEGRPLILGGVAIPFDLGLMGHSDADIVCHAVTDAVLGAAGLGDIGRHFPDTDPRWKGADSVALLAAACGLVRQAGYGVVNVDVTVIAERPKLAPHAEAMRRNLAGALGCAVEQVSVKAKTNEGVESMGAGTSMAAHAVALIARGA
ncbi:MAG TPA: 2-C-methyl-D-erythritol 4-phosphate cytidylyltransferase [Vicinamibacterales bacterium]|nr:2-C-methyl-D-erythritol 4-phosphate cytidylyltransferase [Vicinamibacterales bacterium]